jgi:hypothetical protein
MVFDWSEVMTTGAGSPLCDEGANLIPGNFRLEPPDQVFSIIVRKTEVSLRRQIGPLNVADDRRLQISCFINTLELHYPIHRGPLRQETPNHILSFLAPPISFRSQPRWLLTLAAAGGKPRRARERRPQSFARRLRGSMNLSARPVLHGRSRISLSSVINVSRKGSSSRLRYESLLSAPPLRIAGKVFASAHRVVQWRHLVVDVLVEVGLGYDGLRQLPRRADYRFAL